MIGLDTNVLVRYFAQDDAEQSTRATVLIESLTDAKPGYLSQVVLIELVWVLQRCYDASREMTADTLERLLRTQELVVQDAEQVWQALRIYRQGGDFADCLIARVAMAAGCDEVVTFDKGAAKVGMRPL
jgi:predicted nucleic-acid-binding protein